MTTFDKTQYAAIKTDEDKAAYMTACFGDDKAAKEAALKV